MVIFYYYDITPGIGLVASLWVVLDQAYNNYHKALTNILTNMSKVFHSLNSEFLYFKVYTYFQLTSAISNILFIIIIIITIIITIIIIIIIAYTHVNIWE